MEQFGDYVFVAALQNLPNLFDCGRRCVGLSGDLDIDPTWGLLCPKVPPSAPLTPCSGSLEPLNEVRLLQDEANAILRFPIPPTALKAGDVVDGVKAGVEFFNEDSRLVDQSAFSTNFGNELSTMVAVDQERKPRLVANDCCDQFRYAPSVSDQRHFKFRSFPFIQRPEKFFERGINSHLHAAEAFNLWGHSSRRMSFHR